MAKKRIFWQLFPSYLLITFTALLAVGGYASNSLREFYYDRTAEDLKARTRLIESQVVRKTFPFKSFRWQTISTIPCSFKYSAF